MALSTRKKWQSERRSLIKRGKWKQIDLINSLHACWVIFHDFLSSADFFQKLTFSKNYFRNTIRVPNSLDPDRPDACRS